MGRGYPIELLCYVFDIPLSIIWKKDQAIENALMELLESVFKVLFRPEETDDRTIDAIQAQTVHILQQSQLTNEPQNIYESRKIQKITQNREYLADLNVKE